MVSSFALRTTVLAFMIGCSVVAESEELEPTKDTNLNRLLNNVEMMTERLEFPFRVRLLGIQEPGECDGPLSTCPTSKVYIAVSSYDEIPDQVTYQLPDAFDWTFDRWVSWPESDRADQFVELALIADEIVTSHGKESIEKIDYLVRVNLESAAAVPR